MELDAVGGNSKIAGLMMFDCLVTSGPLSLQEFRPTERMYIQVDKFP